ncbi:MAG: hypothetical protein PUH21_07145 [Prevotellaceae bacterium]|nr:hypothetical protein [Prevotellaceae bacterium]MDY3856094.1 hypothetical protein [Bacteroidaceae bacterium]
MPEVLPDDVEIGLPLLYEGQTLTVGCDIGLFDGRLGAAYITAVVVPQGDGDAEAYGVKL